MSWPIVLGSLSFTVMEFTDKLMVARLGTAPLAALGSAGLWAYTLCTVILGIIGCVSTFTSQSLGRGNKELCASYAWQGLYLASAAGLLTLAIWPLCGPLFSLMHHEPEVTRLETDYLRIRLLGYLPMAWITALAAFFQGVKRPQLPMYTAVAGVLANIVLAYAFIFGKLGCPRWEVYGAAVAMVIAQYLQLILLMIAFLSRTVHKEYGTRTSLALHGPRMRELMRIGFPNGMNQFFDIAMWAIFTGFIIGGFGQVQLAAHNIALGFMQVCFMPAVAVNQAIAPIVGHWIGCGRAALAKQRTYTAIALSMAYMMVAGVVFAVFGRSLIERLFSHDPELIRLGGKILILAAFFQAFDAINIVCMGALRGAGDTRWVFFSMMALGYLFFLPLSILFAIVLDGQVIGAWIAATLFLMALSLLLFRRFQSGRWNRINIFSHPLPAACATDP
jgi:MATE family multidrug resistance protein